jgi:EmrB/QacA subfamily drug resistance transporter
MATTFSVTEPTRADRGSRHQGVALLVIATAQLMVVLDATIVTVALPHIQRALGFSDSNLEWVVNAYTLTLGGLLLLGGRAGDLFGRRRMFVTGLLLFSAASLAGGLATSQAWLLAARAVQGAGGAIVAPTALSLVATTFPQGPARNRAMGVYSAMSVAGGVLGLVAGGLLVTYVSWRWVLFVNVPLGIAAAITALAVLPHAPTPHPLAPHTSALHKLAPHAPARAGRFDVLGAITGTGGVAALVYGLSQADNGTSRWGSASVVAALAAGVALLAAFAVAETRSRHALLPVRLLRDRNRVGAYLIMLVVGTVIGGVFFFLTLLVQQVWGYSPLRTGVAFLPFTAIMLVATVAATKLIPRIGARPLLLAGTVLSAGGLYWLSRVAEQGTYTGALLGPALIIGGGLGLMFLPLSLVCLAGVAPGDSGAASSLLNAGRQVGASIGLAALGTVAWTVFANSDHDAQAGRAAAQAAPSRTASAAQAAYRHALTAGFDRAFLVAAVIALLMLVIAITMIRIRRADLRLPDDRSRRAVQVIVYPDAHRPVHREPPRQLRASGRSKCRKARLSRTRYRTPRAFP